MANSDGRFKVFIQEEDYYSNPEVVVIVAHSQEEVAAMHDTLDKIGHERLLINHEELHEVYQGIWGLFVLRPPVWNREKVSEPVYPPLIQAGEAANKDEHLRVYLKVQDYRVRTGEGKYDNTSIPEVVVITAASFKEANRVLKRIGPEHEDLVRTTMAPVWYAIRGDLIEIDQSIRQVFILRPRGNADLR